MRPFLILFVVLFFQLTQPANLKAASISNDVGPQGSLSVWFKTDQTYGGHAKFPKVTHQLVHAPKLFDINIQTANGRAMIFWKWDRKHVKGCDNLNIQIPFLTGPAWYHLFYHWDANKGVFTGYLNGTPLRLQGTKLKPWKMGTGMATVVQNSPFQTKEFSATATFKKFDKESLPKNIRGNMDAILGAKAKPYVALDSFKGKLLHNFNLTRSSDIKGWTMEGPGKTTFDANGMTMVSTVSSESSLAGHIVNWMPHDLPESFVAQWTMQPITELGLCITFFAAKGVHGKDIFAPSIKKRDGIFKQYIKSDINCYHFSYYANTPFNPGRITTNLRKNSGFHLISNGNAGVTPGSKKVHHISMMKKNGRIVVNVDGKTILDYLDDGKKYGSVHGGGKFGFRQMQWTQARYKDLKIFAIK